MLRSYAVRMGTRRVTGLLTSKNGSNLTKGHVQSLEGRLGSPDCGGVRFFIVTPIDTS
jgi:hypothetical protein